MRGKHRVVVSTKRLRYDFELRRNLTVIRGDSATGKTTLVDMIQEYTDDPSGSPVELICDKADNYYVIISREALPALPYSVEEIYGIRTSGKYGTLKQSYHEFYRIYGADIYKKEVSPEMVVTEDSHSGFEFFEHVCRENDLKCQSVNGKSNVFHYMKEHQNEKILVIADGAAFGSEIDRILRLMDGRANMALYLPESFEWLVLSSDILKNNFVSKMLENPSNYVESGEYFSWERYFTAVLTEETKDTYLVYSKKGLNPAYLNKNIKDAILGKMEKIRLQWKSGYIS